MLHVLQRTFYSETGRLGMVGTRRRHGNDGDSTAAVVPGSEWLTKAQHGVRLSADPAADQYLGVGALFNRCTSNTCFACSVCAALQVGGPAVLAPDAMNRIGTLRGCACVHVPVVG